MASGRSRMMNKNAPLIIGGSGGSGTRVVALLCALAGYDMGSNLNEACDAMDFVSFYDTWINRYSFNKGDMSPEHYQSMENEFSRLLNDFRAASGDGASFWGWKNPRSMLMLPFFDDYFNGNMKFIHVIRDGRDMAFSKNQQQFRKHGEELAPQNFVGLSNEARSIHFWGQTNMLAASYGENLMADRYFRVRFEDLCLGHGETLEALSQFIDRSFSKVELHRVVLPPKSIGRWKKEAPFKQDEVSMYGSAALHFFKYI